MGACFSSSLAQALNQQLLRTLKAAFLANSTSLDPEASEFRCLNVLSLRCNTIRLDASVHSLRTVHFLLTFA
jgi:hypothetical protein